MIRYASDQREAANFLPPEAVAETAWDILLALRGDRGCRLGLDKLGNLVSVPRRVLEAWLALLERRGLITGVRHGQAQQLRAVLTPAGRALLDRYLSASCALQGGAYH